MGGDWYFSSNNSDTGFVFILIPGNLQIGTDTNT